MSQLPKTEDMEENRQKSVLCRLWPICVRQKVATLCPGGGGAGACFQSRPCLTLAWLDSPHPRFVKWRYLLSQHRRRNFIFLSISTGRKKNFESNKTQDGTAHTQGSRASGQAECNRGLSSKNCGKWRNCYFTTRPGRKIESLKCLTRFTLASSQ